jgi:hypothetical protein
MLSFREESFRETGGLKAAKRIEADVPAAGLRWTVSAGCNSPSSFTGKIETVKLDWE